jgi:hypothetical protein
MGCGAEHIIVFRFLEDARRAAIHQHQHLLQFFGDRRDSQAVTGADIAEHDVDIVALIEVAQFLHLLGRAAVLVDDDRLDLHAAEPDLLVRLWCRALVQLVDDVLPTVARGHAKTVRRGSGQEGHDAELEGFLRGSGRRQRQRRGDGRQQRGVTPYEMVHGSLPWMAGGMAGSFVSRRCPDVGVVDVSLGGVFRRVYGGRRNGVMATRGNTCVPGAMQRAALLRRTGTVPNTAFRYGPGSAAHHAAKSGALRCVRGTELLRHGRFAPSFPRCAQPTAFARRAMAVSMVRRGYPLKPSINPDRGGALRYIRLVARTITPASRADRSIAVSRMPFLV